MVNAVSLRNVNSSHNVNFGDKPDKSKTKSHTGAVIAGITTAAAITAGVVFRKQIAANPTVQKALKAAKDFFNVSKDKTKEFTGKAADKSKETLDSLIEKGKSLLNTSKDTVEEVTGKAADKAGKVFDKSKKTAGSLFKKGKAFLVKVYEKAKAVFQKVVNWFKNLFKHAEASAAEAAPAPITPAP
jgi:hypothetical protein